MSKNELKSRLIKMGMSFDKTDHPKSYYLNLYLEKFNAQNKITRSKNSFGREMLKVKRERANSKEKHDSDYNVEEDDKIELNDSDEEYIYEESEENDIDNKGKKISWEEEIKERNKYYKESGIKYIRLIRRKKQKIEGGKKLFVTDQIHEDSTDKKKSFNEKNDNSINDNEKIIIINKCENKQKNEDIDINNSKKNILNETPLKQSSQNSENIIIENNEFSKENKIPKSENINTDINIKSSSLEKKSPSQSPSKSNQKTPPNSNVTKITFGAPKSANENNNIHLSKGPVVFGFKKSTDAEKKLETESEKDKKMFKTVVNKSKIYDNFVKNVTKSVMDNANQSPEKKAKTIYLKWDTPRQKEFLKNYMDEYPLNNELNSENKITVNYDFNERLNNYDDNEYKHKLRSYNKNINKYEDNNINNSEKKDDINEEKEMKSNNHFFHKDNLENNQRNNYMENQNYENDYNDKKDVSKYDAATQILNNKEKYKLTEIDEDNIKRYIKNSLYDLSDEEINEMKDYVESNDIYAHVDEVYTPNGIKIEKIYTYDGEVEDIPEIYRKIIKKKSCTVAGYKFTIKNGDNEKIIYVNDKKIFQEAVDNMASIFVGESEYKKYKEGTQSPINSTGSVIEKVYLEEDISYKAVNIDTKEKIYTSTSDLSKYLLYGDNYEEKKVTVNEGDSISTLAFANEISVDEFLISNPEYTNKNNLLYPGKEVIIAKTSPQINLVVETYSVEDKESNFTTIEQYDENMTQGNSLVTQDGETGIERVSQNVKWVNGQITYIEPVGKEVIKTPVNKVITVGTKVIPNVGSTTSWGWPTNSGYTISSPYGYRVSPISGGRELHSGIDISGTGYGSPAYASNNGTIIEMQYHYSYGNYVLIDHGNGYYSQYAHLSRFVPGLSVGSIVERGQQVGFIGMTGSATGPHLHYEIRTCSGYHCTVNPLNYYK